MVKMSRRATLIITGLLICSMNAPFVTYAAMNKAVVSQTAVSETYADKKHVKKRRKLDVGALVKDNVISKETGEIYADPQTKYVSHPVLRLELNIWTTPSI